MSPVAGRPAPTVVLVEPQMADNIGMVARAMANFELDSLRLVNPRDGWPNAKAEAAASGAQAIVHEASAFTTLKEAIGDQHWVAATTARPRHLAKPVLTPEQAAAEMARRIDKGEKAAIIFGPERTGLSTEHVSLAEAIVMAPVSPDFASLNLSQAVLIVGYEWMKLRRRDGIGRQTGTEPVSRPGLALHSPPATKEEVLGLIEHFESELEKADHFRLPEKRPIMMRNLRSVFERMTLSQQEVRTLRGIVSSLTRSRRS
jgi:tRNA/rRNA methyltransferase